MTTRMLRFFVALLPWVLMVPTQAAEYRLGAGDQVKITVYNNPDLTTEAELSESGTINFPLVGEVKIGGLSKADAERAISQRLDTGGFIPRAQVNFLVTQYRSQQVSVLGEVNKPGKYPISQSSSLTDLLAAAGGVTSKGSSVVTITKRDPNGKTVRQEVDISGLFAPGDVTRNVQVEGNDIIYVPPAPVFYIYGEVRQPGAYPLTSNMTVRQALSVGGGLTVRGTERGIRVERRGSGSKVKTFRANLSEKLQPNDVVEVPESWF